ncbi:DUF1456 family protein [Jeotgalibacillus salarius]|uniref:DUF1456 family protein n=1 Tax=Jeotgalibacillus salarius TaxID=546023 RepID=A0A4Y8LN44_9BACL|nr:DUF1456 family protein [Jeotgalibacillus salarius]TFE04013.1 DUF1456 family protein [Jeotgalibacillus salarius]
MTNNDILIRLRYALDIKNVEMVEIFKLGGVDVSKEDVLKILTKIDEDDFYDEYDEPEETEDYIKCTNSMLESFLNGFIIFKRGPQEPRPGQSNKPDRSIKNHASVNNVLLKKVKIALSLTSEEMLDLFDRAGITVTKGELSALLRKEGHKNYKPCMDRFARNFLKGLTLKYRDDLN